MVVIDRALCPVLIGREEELSTLEDALLAATRGEGQVVLLGGEAGLGKTRMATELMRRGESLGCTVLIGGCSEAELALPYLPLLEAIGNYLAGADLVALRERLGSAVRDLAQLFPQFALDGDAGGDRDSTQAKVRLYEGLFTLLRVLAEERAVLLTIEDLHWADPSTREVLDYLTRRLRGARIMLLGTYRRDELHRKHPFLPVLQGWRRSGIAQVVEIEPLPSTQVADMIRAIFDLDLVTPDFRDLLYERSEGNPFVLEEMLKEAIDRGDMFRTATGWESKEVADLRIPQSVADSILLRVERLNPDHAEVLRAASVLGAMFDYPTLLALSGSDELVVKDALRECIAQQLIVEDPSIPGRYRFRHALTRESIYEDLIQPDRRSLHARAAEVLAAEPATPPAELARHLLAAGRVVDAAPHCIRAAEDALARFAFDEAIELYERALPGILDDLGRGKLLCEIGKTLWRTTKPTSERYLQEGIAVLEGAGADVDIARYRLVLGRVYWERGDPDAARNEYESALPVLEAAGPSEDLAVAYIRLAGLHAFDLESKEARRLAGLAKDIGTMIGSDVALLFASLFDGMGMIWEGNIDGGLAVIDASERRATELNLDWVSANAAANAVLLRVPVLRASEVGDLMKMFSNRPWGIVYTGFMEYVEGSMLYAMGDLDGAIMRLLESQEALLHQTSFMEPWCRGVMAQAYAEREEFDRAMEVLPATSDARHRHELLWFATNGIRVYMGAGDADKAASVAFSVCDNGRFINGFRALVPEAAAAFIASGNIDAASSFTDACGNEPDRERPYMELARGRVALARGDAERARQHLENAADGFTAARYLLDEQRARLDLGRVLAEVGERDAAVSELENVLSLARKSGSTLMERQVRAAAAELAVELTEPQNDQSIQPAVDARDLKDATERLVTVMFADVRGYTAMTTQTAPHELAEKVGAFHRWAQREIERRHGLVDKFAGDAVMATFNVSGRSLDHALHAVQAAVMLQDKAVAAKLPVGVGIAVGPAIVGRLTEGANVSVLGEATNLAARLQAQAQAGEILLSEEAFRRVRTWIDSSAMTCESVLLSLKGFEGEVKAFVIRRQP
ncbi:MAG: AAA family ATPase [Actinobacteria bacterium]|nr:AAA family ATPase [Actinomycetota bacterium]